jgi:hypothetical protein
MFSKKMKRLCAEQIQKSNVKMLLKEIYDEIF